MRVLYWLLLIQVKIKKTVNFDKLKKDVSRRVDKAFATVGNFTVLRLKKRIKKGIDDRGNRFKPLNAEYRKLKSQRNKEAMFEFSGDMLRSMTHKAKGSSVKIYFDDASENNKAYQNIYIHKRDFMLLSKKEIDDIIDKIENALGNI